ARGCVQQPQSVRADMESAPTAVKQLLLVGQKLRRRNVQIVEGIAKIRKLFEISKKFYRM
uniref:hypothetical protein n=1 Tax=Alistipes shahii TaxID=328814 RepID=UPI003FEDC393